MRLRLSSTRRLEANGELDIRESGDTKWILFHILLRTEVAVAIFLREWYAEDDCRYLSSQLQV